jgi:hypothetical protein
VRISRAASFKATVERSRFFAVVFPAASEEDVLAAVKAAKGEHRKANHHCWAFRGRDAAGALVEKSKDDVEVGHPGRLRGIPEGAEGGVPVARWGLGRRSDASGLAGTGVCLCAGHGAKRLDRRFQPGGES